MLIQAILTRHSHVEVSESLFIWFVTLNPSAMRPPKAKRLKQLCSFKPLHHVKVGVDGGDFRGSWQVPAVLASFAWAVAGSKSQSWRRLVKPWRGTISCDYGLKCPKCVFGQKHQIVGNTRHELLLLLDHQDTADTQQQPPCPDKCELLLNRKTPPTWWSKDSLHIWKLYFECLFALYTLMDFRLNILCKICSKFCHKSKMWIKRRKEIQWCRFNLFWLSEFSSGTKKSLVSWHLPNDKSLERIF